jgi:hypothetical protein
LSKRGKRQHPNTHDTANPSWFHSSRLSYSDGVALHASARSGGRASAERDEIQCGPTVACGGLVAIVGLSRGLLLFQAIDLSLLSIDLLLLRSRALFALPDLRTDQGSTLLSSSLCQFLL